MSSNGKNGNGGNGAKAEVKANGGNGGKKPNGNGGKPAPAAKPAQGKAKAKAKATKPANGAAKKGEHGVERSKDLRWCDKKVAIFKALKALKATSQANARGSKEVADKAGVTERDVRHYVYHAMVSGHTGISRQEGKAGYLFYLTAKGAKLDPAQELKAQEAAKSAK
jgi:hypothetical protein